MEQNLKVLILGKDEKLLEKNCERLNSSHPVEVLYFTELKDFLEQSISLQPDIVGVSFSYPHKSISQFPRIIEMAINVPVIVFGEDRDNKVIQAIMGARTLYKITGGMTAQNMWVQISKFIKNKEEAENPQKVEESELKKNDNKNNTVFLKGDAKQKTTQEKSSLLSSLFSSLNNGDTDANLDKHPNIIKSSQATEFKKEGMNHIDTSDTRGLFGEEEDAKNFSEKENDDSNNEKKTAPLGHQKKENKKEGEEESKKSQNHQAQLIDFNKRKNVKQNKNDSYGSNEKQNKINNLRSEKNGTNNKLEKEVDSTKDEIKKNSIEKPSTINNKTTQDFSKPNDDDVEKESKSNGGKENNDKKRETNFGSIKLADEKEVKENLRKIKKEKKEKIRTENKNLLAESCELALKKCFSSRKIENPWAFDSNTINVFILEMQNLKGFLFLANSFKSDMETYLSEEFRATIIENFKKNGFGIEISHPHPIKIITENYPDLVQKFSEFVIGHEEENGKQQVVSFMQREVVQPQIELSEREEMYSIDIKTIPPQTKVNFDAFIYLPKNQRYVRYLKDGRSLSLEQAKRQSEVLNNSKLYLPKEQKQKFIEFFVQNTVDWEIAINKNKIAI